MVFIARSVWEENEGWGWGGSEGRKAHPSSQAFLESTWKISEMTDVGDRCPNIHSIVRLNELAQEGQLENSLIRL